MSYELKKNSQSLGSSADGASIKPKKFSTVSSFILPRRGSADIISTGTEHTYHTNTAESKYHSLYQFLPKIFCVSKKWKKSL